MIRFTSLKLENFHLVRSLTIPFSTDPKRPLSVIRAEPASGKTTIFRAFRWVLYDEEGLPNGGKAYPVGSMAHNRDQDGAAIQVAVTLDFEVLDHGTSSPYELKRSVIEEVNADGTHRRGRSDVALMRQTHNGWTAVVHPELSLERFFPKALRDVFFTNGDEAMRFIARDVAASTKRERVRGAIRNLLGINLLEDAEGHLAQVASAFNAEVRSKGGNVSLHQAAERTDRLSSQLTDAQGRQDALQLESQLVDEARSAARERLEAALQRGNRSQLVRDRRGAEEDLRNANAEIAQIHREKSDLLKTQLVALPFLGDAIERARARLSALKEEGAIPSDYLPLLKERLESGRCVCGTELTPGSPQREAVEKLLKDQESNSAVKDRLTGLYYATSAPEPDVSLSRRLSLLEARSVRAQANRDAEATRIRALDLQISQIGDADVDALQANFTENDDLLRKATSALALVSAEVKRISQELAAAETERNKLLQSEKGAQALQAKLLVVNDLRQVISGAKAQIQVHKVREVSEEMDLLFRRMIGSDADGALIKRAEITTDFDVLVFSETDAPMDPDMQLNGASQRAITLAFILALEKVSGFQAPNVIDTPLGMMGIQVKQAALTTLVRESSQPILFLTWAEIRDIEETLDRYAGSFVTLTMTGHYPTYLTHKPSVEGNEILRCDCNHRQTCNVCERVFTTADIPVPA